HLLKNNITSLHRIRATTAFNFTSSPQIFTTSGFSFTYTPNSKPMSHIRKNLHQPLDQLHIFHSTPHLNRSPSAPRQHLVTTSSSPHSHPTLTGTLFTSAVSPLLCLTPTSAVPII